MRLTILAVLLVIAAPALAHEDPTVETQPANPPSEVGGAVPIDHNVIVELSDQSDEHFHRAMERLANKEYKRVATELRKGAAFLRVEASRSDKNSKAALNGEASKIERLAKDFRGGAPRRGTELEHRFAVANSELAVHFHAEAVASWAEKDVETTRKDLSAAALASLAAADWAHLDLDESARNGLDEAHTFGDSIVGDGDKVKGAVDRHLQAVGEQVAEIHDQISHSPEK